MSRCTYQNLNNSQCTLIVFVTNCYSHDIVQPDNSGGHEDCVFMYALPSDIAKKGQWGDWKCNVRSNSVLPLCERDLDFKGIFLRITGSRKNLEL